MAWQMRYGLVKFIVGQHFRKPGDMAGQIEAVFVIPLAISVEPEYAFAHFFPLMFGGMPIRIYWGPGKNLLQARSFNNISASFQSSRVSVSTDLSGGMM